MPYELLTIVANGANDLKNKCLRVPTNRLENVTNVLMNDTNVLPTLPLSCNFLTNNANI